jgi:imidazolonepropionase
MPDRPAADLVIVHAAALCRVADRGGPRRGALQDELDLIADGAVAVADGRILAVGTTAEVLAACDTSDAEVVDASGRTVLPGLVEAHSHPVFADSRRYLEYARKLAGATRDQINAEGGGIWNSVLATRAADDETLAGGIDAAFARMLADGITTVEAKSGYGLTTEQELRALRLLAAARERTPLDVVITFLGAHIVPGDSDQETFTRLVCEEMLPAAAATGIPEFCDITCEAGSIEAPAARRVAEAAARHRLPTRIHADGFAPSTGWRMAVESGAHTAEHVTFTPDEEIRAAGRTDTIAVLLPAAEMEYLVPKRANARLLIAREVPVAIATDYCSSIAAWSLRASIGLASAWFGLTPGEAIVGATLNAAYSLNRARDAGSLDPGKQADILMLAADHPYRLVWELGQTPVAGVWKRGVRVG